MKARVYVTYRTGILDPQGNAVARSLAALGFDDVTDVRIGKLIEIDLCVEDRTSAVRRLDEMCRRLLANPVIEEYRCEIVEGSAAATAAQSVPPGP
ncbi:MAG: phosphoribosylformylglycinamidine synthase subunit PurS [Nitrospiria bacterium]